MHACKKSFGIVEVVSIPYASFLRDSYKSIRNKKKKKEKVSQKTDDHNVQLYASMLKKMTFLSLYIYLVYFFLPFAFWAFIYKIIYPCDSLLKYNNDVDIYKLEKNILIQIVTQYTIISFVLKHALIITIPIYVLLNSFEYHDTVNICTYNKYLKINRVTDKSSCSLLAAV